MTYTLKQLLHEYLEGPMADYGWFQILCVKKILKFGKLTKNFN